MAQRNLMCIAEHTVDTDLIKPGGICIDVGCRGFEFALAMKFRGMNVKAFDLEPLEAPEGIEFYPIAIGGMSGYVQYVETKDPNAKYITREKGKTVTMMSLEEYVKTQVDLIKLDCEGSEMEIVRSMKRPLAKQISIEWHMHMGFTKADIEQLFDHLRALGYDMAYARYERDHGLSFNYWDTLFLLR